MSLRAIALVGGLAAAIGVTALFSSFAVSSTATAANAGNATIERTIPNYMLRWENPLVPSAPVAPILGH